MAPTYNISNINSIINDHSVINAYYEALGLSVEKVLKNNELKLVNRYVKEIEINNRDFQNRKALIKEIMNEINEKSPKTKEEIAINIYGYFKKNYNYSLENSDRFYSNLYDVNKGQCMAFVSLSVDVLRTYGINATAAYANIIGRNDRYHILTKYKDDDGRWVYLETTLPRNIKNPYTITSSDEARALPNEERIAKLYDFSKYEEANKRMEEAADKVYNLLHK